MDNFQTPQLPASWAFLADYGTLVVLLATIVGFLVPMLLVYPPVSPRASDILNETHSKLGLGWDATGKEKEGASGSSTAGRIASLWIYPIKSCQGIRVERSQVLPTGFEFDRLFTFAQLKSVFPIPAGTQVNGTGNILADIADEDPTTWEFITQRQFPRLATLQIELWRPDLVKVKKAQSRMRADDWAERHGSSTTSESYVVVRYPWQELGSAGKWAWVAAKLSRGFRAVPEVEVVLPLATMGDEVVDEAAADEKPKTEARGKTNGKTNKKHNGKAKKKSKNKTNGKSPSQEKVKTDGKAALLTTDTTTLDLDSDLDSDLDFDMASKTPSKPYANVRIWRDVVRARNLSDELPRSLQLYLGVSNKLGVFRVDPSSLRQIFRCAPRVEEAGYQPVTGFQDAYPVHLLNRSSIEALEGVVETDADLPTLDERRFRANIILSDVPAYDEDSWKSVSFKPLATSALQEEAKFHVSCRTVRCKMPNVDPDTGERHRREPDHALRHFRDIDEGAPKMGCLGMQLTPLFEQPGQPELREFTLETGMEVDAVERGAHKYVRI